MLFGWYAFGKVNPVLAEKVWMHADLPHVKEWVQAMENLVEAKDLPKASL